MATRFGNGFGGMTAVVTGGGTGMGRELVLKLTAQGCDVATCDVIRENLDETAQLAAGNKGQLLTFIADVSDEAQVLAFRDAVRAWRPALNLLFNNAGIGGGGSFLNDSRESWEKTFGVCFHGVYYHCRAFMDMLIAACFRFGVQRRLTPCETECRLDPANAPALALLATALLRAREAPDAVAASRRAGDQQTDLTNRGPRDWQVRP